MVNKESILLFLKKEGKVLSGRRSINLFMIFLIFFISILSIAFARAGLYYLESKMDDPFVKWVDIKALQKSRKGGILLEKFLNSDSIQTLYDFSNPKPNYTYSPYFCKITDGSEPQFQGRSFDTESALFDKIVEKGKNGIVRQDDITNDSFGIIITLDALKDLGYINSTKSYDIEQLPGYVNISIPFDRSVCTHLHLGSGNEGYYPVSIPIVAVVKDLPGVEYSFMFSNEFLNVISDRQARDITSIQNNQSLHLYGNNDSIAEYLTQIRPLYGDSIVVNISKAKGWNTSYQEAFISVAAQLNDTAKIILINDIANQIIHKENTITRIYDFESKKQYKGIIPLYSIEINDLRKIRDLQNALKSECNIRLDMRSIESQENFQKMETVGIILSSAIIILALLFVTVFIFFLLNTHFQSIQMNLGTFKAFGIDNLMLYSIYLVLMLGMTLFSFLTAWLLIILVKYGLDYLDIVFEQGFSFFDVFSLPILVLFIFAMIDAVAATLYIANNTLNHTPGNLIYNRNSK